MIIILPMGHDQGRRRTPWVTLAIMALCLLVQGYRSLNPVSAERLMGVMLDRQELLENAVDEEALAQNDTAIRAILDEDLAYRWGTVARDPTNINVLLYAFVHAGWLHFAFNMLFLWLTGSNVEDRWGPWLFAGFYGMGAIVAALTFQLWHPSSSAPLVGASGAVAAAMGAFFVAYRRARLRLWWFAFFRWGTVTWPAWFALAAWFVGEAIWSLFEASSAGSVAHSAHVGGFAFGALFAFALRRSGIESSLLLSPEEQREESRTRPTDVAFEQARAYASAGNFAPAIVAFRQVLELDPRHAAARRALLDLALDHGEPEIARNCLNDVLAELCRTDPSAALTLHERASVAGLADSLSPRALALLAKVAASQELAPLAVALTGRLLTDAPRDPVLPALLWEVAQLQLKAGREDLSQRTLQILLQRFPADPFADRARAKLAASWSAPGPGQKT